MTTHATHVENLESVSEGRCTCGWFSNTYRATDPYAGILADLHGMLAPIADALGAPAPDTKKATHDATT